MLTPKNDDDDGNGVIIIKPKSLARARELLSMYWPHLALIAFMVVCAVAVWRNQHG